MLDSYDKFLDRFNIDEEEFYKFGIDNIIFLSSHEKIKGQFDKHWENLQDNVLNNKEAYIRGHGRDGVGTDIYIAFHKKLFGNEKIKRDPSNNIKAREVIKEITNFEVGEDKVNYQVSHVFGKTRNALLFLAPWNIVLIPKIYDPLSGHEAKGKHSEKFKKKFYEKVFEKYSRYIDEYNRMIKEKLTNEFVEDFVKNEAVKIDPKFEIPKYKKNLIQCLIKDFKPIEKEDFLKN